MKLKTGILLFLFVSVLSTRSYASCGSCVIPQLGKDDALIKSESRDKKWFFEYLFEQKNWDEMDAQAAHELHDDGFHLHDKTTEDSRHFKFGGHLTGDVTVFAEIPYVVRRSLEIEEHDILGSKQKSEGMGDLHLMGDYRFWKDDKQSLSAVGGIKFPTGQTEEKNSIGTLFEPELQPGTGSYDYILGGIYKVQNSRMSFTGNLVYVFNNEGDHDFEFGDVLTTSFYADYLMNPGSEHFKTRVGADLVYQLARKQKDDGEKVSDSGGQTVLLGPVIKVDVNTHVAFFSSVLFPVSQNWGGVHQELDFEWTVGGKLVF